MNFSSQAATTPAVEQFQGLQGIQGQVVRLTGDRMPTVGQSAQPPQPVSTLVWVFAGRIQRQGKSWSVDQARQHPAWRATVSSDAEGQFTIGLPPGEYTLFAQYGQDLYLNAFAGDGTYQTVQVTEGQLASINLVNTTAATF